MKIGRLWIHILPKGSKVQFESRVFSIRHGQPSDAMSLDEADAFLAQSKPETGTVFDWIKSEYPNGQAFVYPEPTRSMHFNRVHWGYASESPEA